MYRYIGYNRYSRLEFIRAAYTKLSKRVSVAHILHAYHYALLLFIRIRTTAHIGYSVKTTAPPRYSWCGVCDKWSMSLITFNVSPSSIIVYFFSDSKYVYS